MAKKKQKPKKQAAKKRKPVNQQARRDRFKNRLAEGAILVGRHSFEEVDGASGFKITHPDKSREAALCTSRMVDHICGRAHNWRVTAFAEGYRPGDAEMYRPEIEFTVKAIQINKLAPLVDPAIQKMKGKINHKHLEDWGWEAVLLPSRRNSSGKPGDVEEDEPDEIVELEI